MNINTSYFSSDAMPATTMNVMTIMSNVLADVAQLKNPFVSDDDSFLMDNGLVEQALDLNVGGTLTIQERAYIQSTLVESLDFGYEGASQMSPGVTKLSTIPNVFTIAEKKYYDKFLTQTLESGVYMNTNRYVTLAIIAQLETLSADYSSKLTKYMEHQATSASKVAVAIIDGTNKVALPFGGLYTPDGALETSTKNLNPGTMGALFEEISRMIAPSHLDPQKGSSGFAAMNSLIYSGLARNPSGFISMTNEAILREMSRFGATLQYPTGQYVTLSRYSIGDRTVYFMDKDYAIPQLDKDGKVVTGSKGTWSYSWVDYNPTTKKWQMIIQCSDATADTSKIAFGDIFYEPFNDATASGMLLESHASGNQFPMMWVVDKPEGFIDEDVSTHFYTYLSAGDSPYGVAGYVVNITLNLIPSSFYPDPNDPTKFKLSKSFSKYNTVVKDLKFDNQQEADSLPTTKIKLDKFHTVVFGTDDPKASTKKFTLFPLANNRESVFMWNPQMRYEIPRPINFTYQGTTAESMRRGNGLSSSNFNLKNYMGSGAFIATIGAWNEEGGAMVRVGLTHTSAWLSHNFNVGIIPIDKTFIQNDTTYITNSIIGGLRR